MKSTISDITFSNFITWKKRILKKNLYQKVWGAKTIQIRYHLVYFCIWKLLQTEHYLQKYALFWGSRILTKYNFYYLKFSGINLYFVFLANVVCHILNCCISTTLKKSISFLEIRTSLLILTIFNYFSLN